MKKTKFEPKMKTIADKLWALTRQIVFILYGTDCYTCPQKKLTGKNLQCGHGYSKGAMGVSMQYDLRILRAQCYNCNINYGGMQAAFWRKLEAEIGREKVDALFLECKNSKGQPIKARPFILSLIETYKTKLNELSQKPL